MEQRAKQFAGLAHGGIDQRREYSGAPYIEHPEAVAEIVRGVPHTMAMLCAAWLHDTVENTPVTLDDIERVFGFEVAALVEMLTDVSRPGDGNRATRKRIDREHTARASAAAKTVKLADLIDNGSDIAAHDPKFARVYLPEMALLLDVLSEGDPGLWRRANALVVSELARLGIRDPRGDSHSLPEERPR